MSPNPNVSQGQAYWSPIFHGMIVLWIIEKANTVKSIIPRGINWPLTSPQPVPGALPCSYTQPPVSSLLQLCYISYISCISYMSCYILSQLATGQLVPGALPSSYKQSPGSTLLWTTTRISVPFSLTLPTYVEEVC